MKSTLRCAAVLLGAMRVQAIFNASNVNDCRIADPNAFVQPYGQCGGQGWTGPTECCCNDQQCQGDDGYKQCKPLAEQGIGEMTHYWDCCKPSCSWTGTPGILVKSCDATGVNKVTDTGEQSICDNPSGSATCKDQMPWIENGILYGFGAVAGDPKTDNICGKCFEVTFTNARHITSAQIMVTNGGNSNPGNIDLLVPGGGFGQFTGCQNYAGWDVYLPDGPCSPSSNSPECALYGGFMAEKYCDSAFPKDPAAQTACHQVLWGVFPQTGCDHDAGYPPNLQMATKTPITCPDVLLSKV